MRNAVWLNCFRCVLNGTDRDYYNDLPGKIPPEAGPPPVPPLPNLHPPATLASAISGAAATASCPAGSETARREHQHSVVQRAQSDRSAGGSCRGKQHFLLAFPNKGPKRSFCMYQYVGTSSLWERNVWRLKKSRGTTSLSYCLCTFKTMFTFVVLLKQRLFIRDHLFEKLFKCCQSQTA